MSHLGSRLSAYVDGQLSPDDVEEVLTHVAACPECHDELAAARAARHRLATAAHVPVDPALTARLLALGAAGCGQRAPDRVRVDVGSSVPMPGSRPARIPADCLRGEVVRAKSSTRVLVGAVGVGIAAVALVALGVQPLVAPPAHPAHALTLLGRASASAPAPDLASGGGESPAVGGSDGGSAAGAAAVVSWSGATDDATVPTGADAVLAWMQDEGWTVPSQFPDGYDVCAVRVGVDGTDALEVDLAGPEGTIVLTEQHGRLDRAAVAGTPLVAVGDREVHLLSDAPWHVVWQSGGTVVSVVAQDHSPAVDQLVTAYPDRAYDDRVAARLARGWDVVAGTWAP
ncbi:MULTISPECIES: anti-sigma factor [unclassified Actinotalea]|uniref:anti-sigma factor family protein n=1 Tax=unclassified Actinotalea TaxID=2638618 RepID=UPI0015F711A5|nr:MULTISPECIES: zf-HC2 domain-containing protein [unclassified Actinotalea]